MWMGEFAHGSKSKPEWSLNLGNSSGICVLRSNLAGACLLSRVKEVGASRLKKAWAINPSDSAERWHCHGRDINEFCDFISTSQTVSL